MNVKPEPPLCGLMDCMMPGMDGFEATKWMRIGRQSAAIPVIAITANASEDHQLACLTAGMNDFLQASK
jgi:CheY-like chemotaxis protein